ncbi:DMT family transporter [Rhizosphaericola mali]|uniref:DMT family transporter n=1 Tax=Rhizosphaericola mali TaxID=2545455 RepID=A0A5P2G3P1_9BACT|nr:DMT family transporter [Rhizosphaericola mali]QES90095.1 DMT family transporter [Rhizosphaericola mali]
MKKSYGLLHIAVLLAGFTGIFGKLITLNEVLLTWYRLFFSAIFLFIALKIIRIKYSLSLQEKIRIGKVGLLITLHWILFYASIKYANISIGVICYSLTSFYTAIFKPIIKRQRFKVSELLLSAITLVGISLIFHFDSSSQIGIILGVISSAIGALYTINNEQLAGKYDSKVIIYYQMIAGTIGLGFLLPIYLYYFPAPEIFPNIKNAVYLILLSLFCTIGLYVMVTEVLKKISAFTVNLTFNLEPIYSIIIAFLFFDEGKSVNYSFYIGVFFVLLSVLLQSMLSFKKSKK